MSSLLDVFRDKMRHFDGNLRPIATDSPASSRGFPPVLRRFSTEGHPGIPPDSTHFSTSRGNVKNIHVYQELLACPHFPTQDFHKVFHNLWKTHVLFSTRFHTAEKAYVAPTILQIRQATTSLRQNRRHISCFFLSQRHYFATQRHFYHTLALFLSLCTFPHHFSTGCGKHLWKSRWERNKNHLSGLVFSIFCDFRRVFLSRAEAGSIKYPSSRRTWRSARCRRGAAPPCRP